MQQSIFIYVVNRKSPNRQTNKLETYEEVSIKQTMIDKLANESTFVLDLISGEIVKNRYEYSSDKEYTFESVMEYLRKNHENVVEVEERFKEMTDLFEKQIAEFEAVSQEVQQEESRTVVEEPKTEV